MRIKLSHNQETLKMYMSRNDISLNFLAIVSSIIVFIALLYFSVNIYGVLIITVLCFFFVRKLRKVSLDYHLKEITRWVIDVNKSGFVFTPNNKHSSSTRTLKYEDIRSITVQTHTLEYYLSADTMNLERYRIFCSSKKEFVQLFDLLSESSQNLEDLLRPAIIPSPYFQPSKEEINNRKSKLIKSYRERVELLRARQDEN